MERAAGGGGGGVVNVAAVVLVWTLVWWVFRAFADRRGGGAALPPGSLGLPFVGEMIEFLLCFKIRKNPDDFIFKKKLRYGDTGVYKTHLFGRRAIVTCSPEVNVQVLGRRTEDGSFGPGWPTARLLGFSSITNAEGSLHKRLRRHIMDTFNNSRSLSGHLTAAQPILAAALKDWASREKIVAFDETKALTFRIICQSLVSLRSPDLLDAMEALYRSLMAGLRAMTINLPGTAFHNAIKCSEKLKAILMVELHRRKDQEGEGSHQAHDYLQMLMDSVDKVDGCKLSEVEIIDNILASILGGYESTSNVMTWSLYYLAKYPRILQKLKKELQEIRDQKEGDALSLTLEDLKNMKYASKVADELIRLANIPPFIFRKVAKDDVVINGYKFPKDWLVLVWIRTTHVDDTYYSDPLDFNPERWEDFKPKPGTYLVFGSGPRFCPGSNFAKNQLMMFLYNACLDYSWELLNPDSGVVYLPHPRPSDGAEMVFRRAAE